MLQPVRFLRSLVQRGFPAGNPDGHALINRSAADVHYLEVGDRMPGDEVVYPDIDLLLRDDAGAKTFTKKSSEPC